MTIHDAPPGHALGRCAVRLRAVVGEVAEVSAWLMTPDEQRAALVELSRAQAQLAELRLRVLAAGDANDIGAKIAASSTAAWLAHQTRQTRRGAHGDLSLARDLDQGFTATRTALARAKVNEDQARVIVAAVNELPETVSGFDRGRAEAHLLHLAADYDAKALKGFGRHIFDVIDPDHAEEQEGKKLAEQERQAARRTWLKIRDNGDGTHTGSFKIPDLHAAMLAKALGAITAPRQVGPDARTNADGSRVPHPELLGRGFCELLERYPANRLPKAGGLNASVVVTMTLEQLLSGLGGAGLDVGGSISAGQARRLACDAGIIPVVLGGRSQVLDVGRKARFHTGSQRIALTVRDGGCTAENCDRPPGWCEAHHETPWSEGGRTSVDEGRLLCSWHHHRAHDTAYQMTRLPNGKVSFHRRT